MFSNNNSSFKIDRYPATSLSSLKPWNAADEYIVSYIEEHKLQSPTVIVNDRFGFQPLALQNLNPTIIIDYKSQEKAILKNVATNNIDTNNFTFSNILSTDNADFNLGIVKVPKSMELFSLYLHQLSQIINDEGTVLCGFMTKYFTPSMLEVANKYFGKVEQSLAWKKSRLLILSDAIKKQDESLTETIPLPDGKNLTQYKGVFSSKKIDVGTRFLLEHLIIEENENTILDLACGNGIIAHQLSEQKTDAEFHLIDDFYLAVESAKLNLPKASCHFNNELNDFQEGLFDLIVTNPPFHFGHETNIEVSLDLFKQTCQCLKSTGRFVIVANKHLNYSTHLRKMYRNVVIAAENAKFQIIECREVI
nr:methyltransferase [uncultured Carboxylicivirga sp.]